MIVESTPPSGFPIWAIAVLVCVALLGLLLANSEKIGRWFSSLRSKVRLLCSLKSQRDENIHLQGYCNNQLREAVTNIQDAEPATGYYESFDALQITCDRKIETFKRIELEDLTQYKVHRGSPCHTFNAILDYVYKLPYVYGTADLFEKYMHLDKGLRFLTLRALVIKSGGERFFKREFKALENMLLSDETTYKAYETWRTFNKQMQEQQTRISDLTEERRRLILIFLAQLSSDNGEIYETA